MKKILVRQPHPFRHASRRLGFAPTAVQSIPRGIHPGRLVRRSMIAAQEAPRGMHRFEHPLIRRIHVHPRRLANVTARDFHFSPGFVGRVTTSDHPHVMSKSVQILCRLPDPNGADDSAGRKGE